MLDCCLYLLDIGSLAMSKRHSAVQVTRALSAACNDNDDNGVLAGNWSCDYTGGKRPTSWFSSTAILLQYWETRKPVKYGQCWVFAAVVTAGHYHYCCI